MTTYTVQTPLGALEITPTDAHHIHVSTTPSNVGGFTVGQYEGIYASVHVYRTGVASTRTEPAQWGPMTSHDWHFSERWTGRGFVPYSQTTQRKIAQVMLDTVRAWVAENERLLRAADNAAKAARVERIDHLIAEHEAALVVLREQRENA